MREKKPKLRKPEPGPGYRKLTIERWTAPHKPRFKEWRYYDEDGRLDRPDGPAVIKYDHCGNITEELWYTKGILTKHQRRDNDPK